MDAVKLSSVSKSYGKVKAVDDLSLQVQVGEIYGFIGPNGAGKSTTIRLLLNFLSADRGEISVMGYSPEKDDVKIKQITGYVSSDTFMYGDMKVRELFRFAESFHSINASARKKNLIDLLDIDTEKRFEQLSFGNRKKVSIACALLHSPRLLIMDEPSNGLDPVIRNNLYNLLKEEQKNGVTIFYSSHVLSEVQKFCTRIGLIKDGRLIRETSVSEFTDIGYLQVRIETDNHPDFAGMQGVADIQAKGRIIQFIYSGNPNDLVNFLSKLKIDSVHIGEPEIENVFMHYFQQ